MLDEKLKHEINDKLRNWSMWCNYGGWPGSGYSVPPTSRDYVPKDDRDRRHSSYSVDVVDAETCNFAVTNLVLAGNTRSSNLIILWWVCHQPARLISKSMHCSIANVYSLRLDAMELFWQQYLAELEKTKRVDIPRKVLQNAV